MKRLILASNTLPVNIQWQEGKYQIEKADETDHFGTAEFLQGLRSRMGRAYRI